MINTYHKYLNLPFKVEPLPMFSELGNDIIHEYVDHYQNSDMDEWVDSLGFYIVRKEVFYTPPHQKIPIHTDHQSYTNHVKINMTWGPDEGVMRWFKSDKSKKVDSYGESDTTDFGDKTTNEIVTIKTKAQHHNLYALEEDCELLYEANTNRPSLVNVGVLHGTNNPTSQGRWTLCFVPKKDGEYFHWDSALKIFKDYLDD